MTTTTSKKSTFLFNGARTEVRFAAALPPRKFYPESTLLVYDTRLPGVCPAFGRWIRAFPDRIAVTAGESLKTLASLDRFLARLRREDIDLKRGHSAVLAAGGGSVGDFAGFFASVYKRGLELHHLPSTWLAAVDSAHGGKTALNSGGAKNQIGTFYSARSVYIARELLASQPEDRAREGLGELVKIALLEGGTRWSRALARGSGATPSSLIWNHLPDAVAAKYRFVRRDPFEQTGVRRQLNLGHTLGHLIEADTGLAHGAAVALGLDFIVAWSRERGYLGARAEAEIRETYLAPLAGVANARLALPLDRAAAKRAFLADKKRGDAATVICIFLRGPGRPLLAPVGWPEFERELKRQGWRLS